ncbi:MAG: 2-amino-4-hydroxy-6-hydroxymethyldihydropteridine diphosphokinase [Gammaproteobacteria bacterium]
MPLLTLSIGSNIEPGPNVRVVVKLLRRKFGNLECSPVYESKTVGFDGDNFLNLVVATETDEPLAEISSYLKSLEDDMGRDRSKPRFSGRIMDVDILTFGELAGEQAGIQLPRAEILENAFVLRPLADLLPEHQHPVVNKTYQQLWSEYDKPEQELWPVDFDWE